MGIDLSMWCFKILAWVFLLCSCTNPKSIILNTNAPSAKPDATPQPNPGDPDALPDSNGDDVTFGNWNYNLKKRCIRSAELSSPNAHEDYTDCPNKDTFFELKTSHSADTGTCSTLNPNIGNKMHISVDDPGPVSLSWMPSIDNFGFPNYQLNMSIDQITQNNGCEALNSWTAITIADNVSNGGGPFASGDQIQAVFDVRIRSQMPNGSAIAFFKMEWSLGR